MSVVNYRYKRNKGGNMIHRSGCGLVKGQAEWVWAQGKSAEALKEKLEAVRLNYRWCKVCFGDHDREEEERQALREQLRREQA